MKNLETYDDRHAILNRPDLHYGVQIITTPAFAASVDSGNCVLLVNGPAATITLPPAATNKGRAFYVKAIAPLLGPVTLTPTGTDTIEGVVGSNMSIAVQFDCLLIVSDGIAGWWIIGEAGPSF